MSFAYDMILLEDTDDTFIIHFSSSGAPEDVLSNILRTFWHDSSDWEPCDCEGCTRDREEEKETHFTSGWLPCSQKEQLLNILGISGFKVLSFKYNFYEIIDKHFRNGDGNFDKSLGIVSYSHAVAIIFRVGFEEFIENFGIPEESFKGVVKVNV
jgi:hypothetical protein